MPVKAFRCQPILYLFSNQPGPDTRIACKPLFNGVVANSLFSFIYTPRVFFDGTVTRSWFSQENMTALLSALLQIVHSFPFFCFFHL